MSARGGMGAGRTGSSRRAPSGGPHLWEASWAEASPEGRGVWLNPPPLAALSPAPAPTPAVKAELEAALAPAAASSPLPALELEPVPAPEPEPAPAPAPAPTPAPEPALPRTPELEPAAAPEPSWPPPGASENGLSEEKPRVLAFPPDLVAEQFTLMDAVRSPQRGPGGAAPSPGVCRPDLPFPGPELMSWPSSQLRHHTPCDLGELLNPEASTALQPVEMDPPTSSLHSG